MSLPRLRLMLLPLAATMLSGAVVTTVSAQSPTPTPSATSGGKPAAPADKPADPASPAATAPAVTPTPVPSPATPPPAVTPVPAPASPGPSTGTTPPPPAPSSAAQAPPPAAPPATTAVPPPAKVQNADPFGEEVTLSARKVVALKGKGSWDSAFETLTDSIKNLTTALDKQGVKPAGKTLIVYTSTDDAGFTFLVEIPVDQDPKNLAKDMSITQSPEGKTLKFVHRGSYDNMDNTYEAITNHLDDKKLEAKDLFIEEYMTDPLKTEEDNLVVNVYVPLK